ncbi:MAG TPA: hypothetical protein VD741_10015, partial [Solirubrobacterales bacterium]|nr:hypothetical protein [Solirubrobacterales bacterium]
LESVDEQRAVVRDEDGGTAFEILAEAAHDAAGATVPTTLAVTQPNLITLTVHHRAGNPAAGGASFAYPISAGEGYETDYAPGTVVMPPSAPPAAAPAPVCLVPGLVGKSLNASRRMLRRSNCKLGPVRGERRRGARVTKQYRKAGRSLPAGAEVGVKLG